MSLGSSLHLIIVLLSSSSCYSLFLLAKLVFFSFHARGQSILTQKKNVIYRKRIIYKIHFGIFDTLRNHGNKDCKHNADLTNISVLPRAMALTMSISESWGCGSFCVLSLTQIKRRDDTLSPNFSTFAAVLLTINLYEEKDV